MTARNLSEFLIAIQRSQKKACGDRAAVVATAILQTVRRALLEWLHRDGSDDAGLAAARTEIETLLGDEFADVARTTRNEIRREDG
jgi:hypothetical protein